MKKPARPKKDVNSVVVAAIGLATGTKKQKGESLISDPKLKKAFREMKKRAEKKP